MDIKSSRKKETAKDIINEGFNMLKFILQSARPKQWYKNIIIFVGIAFSLNILNFAMWLNVILAFIIFCLLSGGVYLINDIIDIEKDKLHPVKRHRPIASGKLKSNVALLFAIIFVFGSLGGSFGLNILFGVIALTYLILNSAYTFYLKEVVIVDVLAISAGFVLRAVAGCVVIDVRISPWLIVCAFLLALFLALGKRRSELLLLGDAEKHRVVLEEYSIDMLEQIITITTSALIVSYSLYTFLADNYFMMLTIPCAIYGLFRYLHLVHMRDVGGEPEILFKDKATLINLILWAVLAVLILYIPQIQIWIIQ